MEFEINDASPVYPYLQLASKLRDKIAAGEYADRLPSLTHLIEESGLTLGTVQRALGVLKDEGLVYGVRGRGTFVKH